MLLGGSGETSISYMVEQGQLGGWGWATGPFISRWADITTNSVPTPGMYPGPAPAGEAGFQLSVLLYSQQPMGSSTLNTVF